jgi:hypothetical protein
VAAGAVAVILAAGIGVLVARTASGGQSEARPDLALTVEQYRDDEVAHAIQVAVRNQEPRPITVETVEFDSPDFEPTGRVAHHTSIPPGGWRIDLKTPYGKGRCDGTTVPARARAATAVLRIESADGTAHDYRYPLPDPQHLLDRLLVNACRLAVVANVADITFGDTWTVIRRGSEPTMRGTIEVRRANLERSLAVTDIQGSVLLAFHPPNRRPLATLPADGAKTSFPLEVASRRCTGHAFGESKQTYYFRIWVSIDGGAPIGITFTPDDKVKAALHHLLELCPPEE